MTDRLDDIARNLDALREDASREGRRRIAKELTSLRQQFPRHTFAFFQGMGSHFVVVAPEFMGEAHFRGDTLNNRNGDPLRFKAARILCDTAGRICDIADTLEDDFHTQIGDVGVGEALEDVGKPEDLAGVITALGLTISASFVPWSKSRSFKAGAKLTERSLNWSIVVQRQGLDVLTVDYTAGVAHCPSYPKGLAFGRMTVDDANAIEAETETGRAHKSQFSRDYNAPGAAILPDVLDVIASLARDADAIDARDFEEWAADLGYDTDSRKAEGIYRACLDTALKLRAALGDADLQRLRAAAAEH